MKTRKEKKRQKEGRERKTRRKEKEEKGRKGTGKGAIKSERKEDAEKTKNRQYGGEEG